MRFRAYLVATGIALAGLCPSPVTLANEQLSASVCDYVIGNDKSRLRKKLKEYRVKVRNIYGGVECGGQSLLRAAMAHDAQEVGVYLAKQLPKAALGAAEKDGLTLVQWADNQGYGGSTIAVTVGQRLQ